MGRRFALVPIAALLAGCAAGFTSGIKRIEPYDPASAYIYGRFSLKGPQGERPGGTMGFEIQCRDGSTYTVGMKVRDSLQVIKVAPAACQIDQFVYATGRSIAERQPANISAAAKQAARLRRRLLRGRLPGRIQLLVDVSPLVLREPLPLGVGLDSERLRDDHAGDEEKVPGIRQRKDREPHVAPRRRCDR